jgi:Family of unknown function (DUF6455)
MFERIKSVLENLRRLKEVETLTDRDLDDLGMSRDQVLRFLQMPADIADRVRHMAQVFGLSEQEVQRDHGAYVALLETCGTCTERAACSHVLALGDEARPDLCRFCLNAPAFTEATA